MSRDTKTVEPSPNKTRLLAALGVLGAGLLWVYWPSFREMAGKWSTDARYSHGPLVPIFSLWLLWHRRERLGTDPLRGSWWGFGLIGLGLALRSVGSFYWVNWVSSVSLLVSVAGVFVLLGGWRALAWGWPAILFLVFMIPLPYRAEVALGWKLQGLATSASTYVMQTLGMAAVAQGYVVHLGRERINIVDACNGLGMMMLFFAFSVAVALVIKRPLHERILVVLAAPLNAVVGNVIRITITGVLKEMLPGSRTADVFYHDLAGWLMMPIALGLLWIEMKIFAHLLIEDSRRDRPAVSPLPLGPATLPGAGKPRPTGSSPGQTPPNRQGDAPSLSHA